MADVSTLIAEQGANILFMEVDPRDGVATVYLAADLGGKTEEEVFDALGRIPDLREIKFIDTLPQEMRENRFRVVLDNIRDGVISIDADGHVRTINRTARIVLGCENKDMIGRHVTDLKLPDHTILECLDGKAFNNVKKNLITDSGRFQYFATSHPILDSVGQVIGAVEICRDMQEIRKLARSISEPRQIGFSDFIGNTPAVKTVLTFAQRIAPTDSIVSICGESGTGKELLARAIHEASGRTGPFVPINCAALTESLLESELFGYVGGAFTGARKNGKPGLFETADNGTLFLDEVGEMARNCQARILRAIQENTVRRIGGAEEIPVHVRILTATHRDLNEMVRDGKFRRDLFYRINVLPVHIPPLRERLPDVPLFVEHFLFILAARVGEPVKPLSPEALDKMYRHDWPGNVRELKNVVERAAVLAAGDRITAADILFSHEMRLSANQSVAPAPAGPGSASPLRRLMGGYERRIVEETLKNAASVRKAARALGISHTALLNKMKKYGIMMGKG